MKMVRIGVYDEEIEYIEILTAYLKQFGSGKWNMLGYTDFEVLAGNIEKNRLDILISTDYEILKSVKDYNKELALLYLAPVENIPKENIQIDMIYRFQSAKEIGMAITKIILRQQRDLHMDKYFVAFYSPIGRCGKTRLAQNIIQDGKYGRWLYLNMEDYSSFETYTDTGDFLYFLKEKRETEILSAIENCDGKIVVGQGAFELRNISKDDMLWLKGILRKSSYNGFVFDMGTGIIKNFELFLLFDYVFVPYISGETEEMKKDNFNKVLQLYDIDEIWEKITYLDMENPEGVMEKIDDLLSLGGL